MTNPKSEDKKCKKWKNISKKDTKKVMQRFIYLYNTQQGTYLGNWWQMKFSSQYNRMEFPGLDTYTKMGIAY